MQKLWVRCGPKFLIARALFLFLSPREKFLRMRHEVGARRKKNKVQENGTPQNTVLLHASAHRRFPTQVYVFDFDFSI